MSFHCSRDIDRADSPHSVGMVYPQVVHVASSTNPVCLTNGGKLDEVQVEFQTYGSLNAARTTPY